MGDHPKRVLSSWKTLVCTTSGVRFCCSHIITFIATTRHIHYPKEITKFSRMVGTLKNHHRQPGSRTRQKTSWWLLYTLCCAGSTAFQQRSHQHQPPVRNFGSAVISPRVALLAASEKSGNLEDGIKSKPRRKRTVKNTAKHDSTNKGVKTNVVEKERMRGYRAILDHQILTMEEEQTLGKKIRKAIAAKEAMAAVIEEKHMQQFEKVVKEEEFRRRMTEDLLYEDYSDHLEDYDEHLEGLSIHGLDVESMEEVKRYGEDLGRIRIQSTEEYVGGLPMGPISSNNFILEEEINSAEVVLTDKDIKTKLGISGGRKELSRILIEGAVARDKLISSNVRLVLSIAKKWCRNADSSSLTLYAGSSTRPSLDEAIQEGIVGLATAADRFDYKRNLKFGTYATYWITNSIRKCFQTASTGCIRVPPNYHQVRQNYQKLVKAHYESTGGEGMPIDEAATELGLAPNRLEFILRSTEPQASLDAPIPNSMISSQAGKGGAETTNGDAYLANILSCSELLPEEQVEMSLLRQCLENAMATELSPHERDVLRLRHGLDDGVSRSIREVCDLLGSLSVSDVRKSENSAFRKLRSPYSVHTYHLLGFLDYVDVDPNAASRRWKK